MTRTIAPAELRDILLSDAEMAVLDVREEGTFSNGHLLLASSLPLSRLELWISDLVPRKRAPIVLCDDNDGLAERAADRLAAFGYEDVRLLEGGVPGWRAAGLELFTGVYVPSKAFGEFVEVTYHTPNISADELKAKLDAGEDVVVLDSRPIEEYRRMNIPTGIDCPGAELAYRVHDLAPSPDTTVVVNCAGRTRSIIGAQSLVNAGIPNKVMALRNGTMGWELAGYTLERGNEHRAPDPSPEGLARARECAERVTRRFGVRTINTAELETWQSEADGRTLYMFDVRHPEEYEAGHLPGSVWAPGGQLVQATDRYAAVRNARIVLIDDTGVRATMTASWLIQAGWPEVAVLENGLAGAGLVAGRRDPAVPGLAAAMADAVDAAELQRLLDAGDASVVDLQRSLTYKNGHIPGAWFAVRSRLSAGLANVPGDNMLVFTCEDGRLARLAASDAAALTGRAVRCLDGGNAAWKAAGLPMEEGQTHMADTPDDVWLRPYDRDSGQESAMNEYLSWELDLVRQLERDGTARFRAFPA